MIGNLIGCLFVLFILFGLLCNLTGDENKGTQIINNCVTAIVIYAMIIVIFSAKNSEVIKLNIPFWNGVETKKKPKTKKNIFKEVNLNGI